MPDRTDSLDRLIADALVKAQERWRFLSDPNAIAAIQVDEIKAALLAEGRVMRVDPVDDSLIADAPGWENIANPFECVLVVPLDTDKWDENTAQHDETSAS